MLTECQEKGVLTRKYLRKIFDKFGKHQRVTISDDQLDIFFHVLDSDSKLNLYAILKYNLFSNKRKQ